MKKLMTVLAAVLIGTAASQAQSDQRAKTATPQSSEKKMVRDDDNRAVTYAHWQAAKRQLESAKEHLQRAKYNPGKERDEAVRHIEEALKAVDAALAAKETPAKSDEKSK